MITSVKTVIAYWVLRFLIKNRTHNSRQPNYLPTKIEKRLSISVHKLAGKANDG
jgi:hypothetical protein